MSEHHSPDFDDELDVAPPPTHTSGQPPRRIGPPADFSRPPNPLRHAGEPPADGTDTPDSDSSGAHRVSEPYAPGDEGHTSVLRFDSDPRIAEARDDYHRRYGPDDAREAAPEPPVERRDPRDQFRPPPPGWGPPSSGPQPPAGWPGHRADARGPQFDQPGPRRPDPRRWEQAQGSGASWNYTDTIRSGEMVPSRRTPPGRGWRKTLYVGSGKLINPGQSPDERYEDELRAKCRTLLRGKYKIGVLGKGGAGKTTTSAGVGSTFAELRQDDRVVAIDADTAFGKLASRVDPKASGSYWELAGDRNLHSFADIRTRVGSNPAGLFVLGGDPATARRRQLEPEIYRQATTQLDRHFTLSIVDCGSTLDADITVEVLSDVDALIVVSSPWFDGASAAGQTLEWLANNGYTGPAAPHGGGGQRLRRPRRQERSEKAFRAVPPTRAEGHRDAL